MAVNPAVAFGPVQWLVFSLSYLFLWSERMERRVQRVALGPRKEWKRKGNVCPLSVNGLRCATRIHSVNRSQWTDIHKFLVLDRHSFCDKKLSRYGRSSKKELIQFLLILLFIIGQSSKSTEKTKDWWLANNKKRIKKLTPQRVNAHPLGLALLKRRKDVCASPWMMRTRSRLSFFLMSGLGDLFIT